VRRLPRRLRPSPQRPPRQARQAGPATAARRLAGKLPAIRAYLCPKLIRATFGAIVNPGQKNCQPTGKKRPWPPADGNTYATPAARSAHPPSRPAARSPSSAGPPIDQGARTPPPGPRPQRDGEPRLKPRVSRPASACTRQRRRGRDRPCGRPPRQGSWVNQVSPGPSGQPPAGIGACPRAGSWVRLPCGRGVPGPCPEVGTTTGSGEAWTLLACHTRTPSRLRPGESRPEISLVPRHHRQQRAIQNHERIHPRYRAWPAPRTGARSCRCLRVPVP
jgi:hypothetical protein